MRNSRFFQDFVQARQVRVLQNKPSCDIAKSSFFLSEYIKTQFFGNKKNTRSARKKTSKGKEEEKISLSVKKSCFAVRNKSQENECICAPMLPLAKCCFADTFELIYLCKLLLLFFSTSGILAMKKKPSTTARLNAEARKHEQ